MCLSIYLCILLFTSPLQHLYHSTLPVCHLDCLVPPSTLSLPSRPQTGIGFVWSQQTDSYTNIHIHIHTQAHPPTLSITTFGTGPSDIPLRLTVPRYST
ncbi:hypothetical protein BKA65DRAFT_195039 [Rhexocercosporidium sp. MPI-PUGE-AT-0058]|nr:hypothetical protein BKA65DRAFT_195039 [Rhexocercosporidium sp. MPI-PUGE-AT-0058]